MKSDRGVVEALLEKLKDDDEALEILVLLAELLAKRARARRR